MFILLDRFREGSRDEWGDAIKREVWQRDGRQCTYVGPDGRRCQERHGIEFEHRDGWALVREHRADRITLRCRFHNQYAADQLYGREFMEAKRGRTRSGTDNLPLL